MSPNIQSTLWSGPKYYSTYLFYRKDILVKDDSTIPHCSTRDQSYVSWGPTANIFDTHNLIELIQT